MKKFLLLIRSILSILFPLVFTACEGGEFLAEGDVKKEAQEAIAFSGTVARTRVDGRNWDEGDAIGVYMLDTDVLAENKAYVTEEGDGEFTYATRADALYFPEEEAPVDFVAYYPYREEVVDGTFILDLTDQSDLAALDLLYSDNATDCTVEEEPELHFERKMAKIIFEVEDKNGTSLRQLETTLEGLETRAQIDLATGDVTAARSSTHNAFEAKRVSANGATARVEAIVLPGEAEFEVTFTVDEDDVLSKSISATFEAGRSYTYEIELTGTTQGEVPPDPPTAKVYRTGWMELPEHVEKPGDYYYAYHMRPDNKSVRNFSICYSADYRCAVWTAHAAHSSWDGGSGRTDNWGYDPIIPTAVQPDLSSSYNGNYSRGHMVASSDRLVSSATNGQTFYYTNMAPQIQNEFNGGIWNKLEQRIQNSYTCADTLYVVTGSHFGDPYRTCTDDSDRSVRVPSHFYKVLLRSKSGNQSKPLSQLSAGELKCVGFWFEHTTAWGTKASPSAAQMKSVAEIETLTGFKFFPNVPNAPKETYAAAEWGM